MTEISVEVLLSSEELVEEFGETVSYEEVQRVLSHYDPEAQEEIKRGIYKKQREFWDNPSQIKYYTEIHPQLPCVEEVMLM